MILVTQSKKEYNSEQVYVWISGNRIMTAFQLKYGDPEEHVLGEYKDVTMAEMVIDDFFEAEEEGRKEFYF